MIDMLLYQPRVRLLTRSRAEITLVPTWFGRLLKRRTRQGESYRARDSSGKLSWWWRATDRHVGDYLERYIEAAPILSIEDMTVEQLLLDSPETRKKP